MLQDAINRTKSRGCCQVYVEAHPDLEVFRLRIGEALNFRFGEDSLTLPFKRKEVRETGPSLDIERGTL